jgi:hypothetical protein
VPASEAVPGDVALLRWKTAGDPEHIGFVIANDQARRVMRTIEGNTTHDDGDQSGGSGVFERERSYDCVVTCARPRYPVAPGGAAGSSGPPARSLTPRPLDLGSVSLMSDSAARKGRSG